MKIAMPVKPKSGEYVLSTAYGKAKFFLIYDTDTNSYEIVENKYLNGRDVANLLSVHRVDVVITNHIGSGAYNHLINLGMKAYFTESKNEHFERIIGEFKEGKLKEITPQMLMLLPQHYHHHHH
ncbi:MAG: NifB/NifX family molybdenum-iron cluster-binding protein [Hydrogenothermaceae bacterium]